MIAPVPRPAWTPGPWQYIASTEHHGPYVTSKFGNTICDCYTMTLLDQPSTRNGGPSKPVPFLGEMADPNAMLIAAAPALYEALSGLRDAVAAMYPRYGRAVEDAVCKANGVLALARGETE